MQRLIREKFGVAYHVDHLGRLLDALEFSPQKPVLRAAERDEQAIQEFRAKTWPDLAKRGR